MRNPAQPFGFLPKTALLEALALSQLGQQGEASKLCRFATACVHESVAKKADGVWDLLEEARNVIGDDATVIPADVSMPLIDMASLQRFVAMPSTTVIEGEVPIEQPGLLMVAASQQWSAVEQICRDVVACGPQETAHPSALLAISLLAQDKQDDYASVCQEILSLFPSKRRGLLQSMFRALGDTPAEKPGMVTAIWSVIPGHKRPEDYALLRHFLEEECSAYLQLPNHALPYAFCLCRQGRLAEALQQFERYDSVFRATEDERWYFMPELATLGRAMTLAALGRTEEARAAWRQVNAEGRMPWQLPAQPQERIYTAKFRVIFARLHAEAQQQIGELTLK